jgi:hypothetical protein
LFVVVFIFRQSHYVAQSDLELPSFCVISLSAGITAMCHHDGLKTFLYNVQSPWRKKLINLITWKPLSCIWKRDKVNIVSQKRSNVGENICGLHNKGYIFIFLDCKNFPQINKKINKSIWSRDENINKQLTVWNAFFIRKEGCKMRYPLKKTQLVESKSTDNSQGWGRLYFPW